MKVVEGLVVVCDLCWIVDVLIEGYWSGVMEWLGFGFDVFIVDNFWFVYGCMIGWGQYGFYVQVVGYDINYIVLFGVLYIIGCVGE